MHQEASNNINSTINQISITDKESAQVLATTLKQFMNSDVQIVYNDADKLNKLYQEFGEIVNTFDSIFYISKDNTEKLKFCVEKMKVFEEDFKNESENGKNYYNNLFVLLLRLDANLFIEKYDNSPDYVKNDLNNKCLYSSLLYKLGRKDDAIKIIDEIISVSNDDKYFIQKCYFLFIDGKIQDLKRVLAKKIIKNDSNGFYGVFELETLYLKDKKIKSLKKMNRKYKNKPLYHLRMAEIIYEIDCSQEQEIKDNLKLAFANIEDNNLLLIMKLIDTSTIVKQEDYLLKLVNDKKYNSILIESRILNLLVYKEDKTDDEIEKIKNILNEVGNTDLVNVDNINAILSINSHKELEAIDFFNKSYEKNKTMYVASNLLNLVLKNNDVRNINKIQDYIDTLTATTRASDFMLISSAYLLLGNLNLTLENAYIGTILSQNNTDYFMRFWAVYTECESKDKSLKNITNESVIEMSNHKKSLKICMDRNIPNRFNINSFYDVRFNEYKIFELNAIGKCIGDIVCYNGENFKVDSITHKYDYFLKLIFPKIKDGQYFKTITNDDSDPLKGIREFLIKDRKTREKLFEAYNLEKTEDNGLPLSFFVNNENKTYRDILLALLFKNDDYKLYAGEVNPINSDKFVIDITSLVMLEQFDLLNKLIEIKDNVYITQSTINTIMKTFNYYLKNKRDTLSVFVDGNNELRKQKMSKDDYKVLQEFWRNILEVSYELNVINHESSMDKINLESCQIDTIDFSIKNNCTLVSEDLFLKKVAYAFNNQIVNSTNFLAVSELLCSSMGEYIKLVNTLSKGKYLYCISKLSLLKITLYSLLNKEYQQTLIEIINNIFSTSFLYYEYLEIVIRVVLYIYYYEAIDDKEFYINLIDKIKYYCTEYKNSSCYDMLDKIKQNIESEYENCE